MTTSVAEIEPEALVHPQVEQACPQTDSSQGSSQTSLASTNTASERPQTREELIAACNTMLSDEQHVKKAQQRLQQLARMGPSMGHMASSDAQFLVATFQTACTWYAQASKQNHTEATYRAGVCYELGLSTAVDTTKAIVFYRKAALLAHPAGMYRLGAILVNGYLQQPPQLREGVCWLQRAATMHDPMPHALHALASVLLSDAICRQTSLVPDEEYALHLLYTAAQAGYEASQCRLGQYYEEEVPNAGSSLYWYSKAAEQGCPAAALGLSGWYLTGAPGYLAQSDRESYLWARRACRTPIEARDYYDGEEPVRRAVAQAYFIVGYYTELGIGTSAERESPDRWYRQAAALGHCGASEKLAPPLGEPINEKTSTRSSIASCTIM